MPDLREEAAMQLRALLTLKRTSTDDVREEYQILARPDWKKTIFDSLQKELITRLYPRASLLATVCILLKIDGLAEEPLPKTCTRSCESLH